MKKKCASYEELKYVHGLCKTRYKFFVDERVHVVSENTNLCVALAKLCVGWRKGGMFLTNVLVGLGNESLDVQFILWS